MSFGRRLALFVLLLVVVPMLALITILLFVSEDARSGKADARLSAGMETAVALYAERTADGQSRARSLARTPGLGEQVSAGDREALRAAAAGELADGAVAVQLLDAPGGELIAVGSPKAIAFGAVQLESAGERLGTVRVSATTADAYVEEVRKLTGRELVLSRGDLPVASTVTPPATLPPVDETVDLKLSGDEFRGRRQVLDTASGETILLLGPRKEGGRIALGPPAAILLVVFLLIAGAFAFSLARELTGLHERVAGQAVTDPLTGLWNRRRLGDLLAREEERHRRLGSRYSVLIVDVDDFKSINDRYGHPQGDAVLKGLADVVKKKTRAIDEAIRYGGDEMAVILPETEERGALTLAERLREAVERRRFELRDGGALKVTVSIGVATAADYHQPGENLVRRADDLLLRAKREGKNRVLTAASHDRATRS